MPNEKDVRSAIQNVATRIQKQANSEGRSISRQEAVDTSRRLAINYERRKGGK
jgi:hypothetical protein